MNISINEAVLPAVTIVEFNDGRKEKITIHDADDNGYMGKIYGKKKAEFFLKSDIRNITIQSDQLTAEQRRVLDELKKGDATASQLGCGMRTLFSLQSFGLVENMERFGTSEVHVHESPRVMTWPLILLGVLSVIGGYVGIPKVLSMGKDIT